MRGSWREKELTEAMEPSRESESRQRIARGRVIFRQGERCGAARGGEEP
jgi:hypothetical protein